jgi:hypothetical protein
MSTQVKAEVRFSICTQVKALVLFLMEWYVFGFFFFHFATIGWCYEIFDMKRRYARLADGCTSKQNL